MKQIKNNIKTTVVLSLLLLFALSSCDDFLDRPVEDNYNVDNFYQTEDQCYQAVNPIYNSPWYDMQRFFIQAGEVMAGNINLSGDYLNFTVTSSDQSLTLASASLWSVNAYCNGVIQNIDMKSSPSVSQEVKNTVKGEALVWKALAYFYLVRSFGAVPIIHDNSAMISAGNYNNVYKATIPNVYDYIIMTLNQAIEWLPEQNLSGRLDRYCAYALLSKVYLTKSGYGQTGSRNQEDLDNAANYAKIVIDQSGRKLLTNYEDIFRLHNNINEECLISWRWVSDPTWTSQNSLQSDLAVAGFDEFNDNWGDWTAPSVDLQDAFGENALSKTRNNRDTRRKATMMMYGDHYDYFWRDKGGFDWTNYVIGDLKAANLNGCGTNCVKHLVGDNADQVAEGGGNLLRMTNGLATHLLRLAEVYLIYAEAKIGNAASTSDPSALDAYNKVLLRAIPGETPRTSITWSDVWKERRLELATEGDRWYDYVRWSYYDSDGAINELRNQRRSTYSGLTEFYQGGSATPDPNTTYYDKTPPIPNPAAMYDSKLKSFVFPFPNTDVVSNPNLTKDPVEQDISQYKY
ncbi:MAG: RagB/SusD family nutrient uptake outer membrane protein [Candidatus Azobacteroides sp.]|nr:RagB/SusD family nutrient uptake outer membrane protein [Candidatus Azobacteroides sp.]